MSVIEIHENILNKLLEYREIDKNFTFYLRQRPEEKLSQGYWFLGNENYVNVPLFKVGDKDNKTQTVGFVYDLNNNKTFIEIVYKNIKDIKDNEIKFYEELVSFLPKKEQKANDNRYWYIFEKVDLIENLEYYLYTFRDKCLDLLNKYQLTEKYIIKNDDFNMKLNKIIEIKNQNKLFIKTDKKKLKNEMIIIEAIENFINELELNENNIPKKGMKFETIKQKKEYYVYTNKNRKIITKPLDGDKQFSQPISVFEKYFKTGEINKDNDSSYIIPIAEYIKENYLEKDIKKTKMNIKNIILYGAPGVGKTHNTNKLISLIDEGKSEKEVFSAIKENINETMILNDDLKSRMKFITFHQSFGYEDFIEGFRPNNEGNIKIKKGIFHNICTEAIKEENKDKNYYLVIDEINRGNISKIFGELITLIEEDKRDKIEVTLPYSKETFKVPSNLFIIGTMNSTDKSIALIDIALRRRFTFLKMSPNLKLIEYKKAKVLCRFLNIKISKTIGKDYKIGHSYFMNISNENDLNFVLEYKITPLLEEYFYGNKEQLDQILKIIRVSP
ncbi:MAG: AAA family ATPase [Arcobacteraceae bacterium]|nr:AAA family ATPase [Arcobacteraceae bacterium]